MAEVLDLEPLAHRPARFWAVDLHVHTPASRDVQEQADKYGATTPEEIVSAARRAGLDAIAVTDHNTVDWCDRVVQAAVGHGLTVLPGVEISTPDGHLLGIWDTGTDLDVIRDVLVTLGIARSSQGRLDVATQGDMAGAAKTILAAGGLAVAAHADREKGLLKIAVKAHMQRTLLEPALAAVEVADLASAEQVRAHVGAERDLAVIQSSDVMLPGQSAHTLAGIGSRRTWIKASQPDLRGLRHAFEDPQLRVRTTQPPEPAHKIIRSVTVNGGFLGGHTFEFSPDLNCLVGGTGAGKSLLIEIIRFVLNQQTSPEDFGPIRAEVDSRLEKALKKNSTVDVVVQVGNDSFTVSRVYAGSASSPPQVIDANGAPAFKDGVIPIRAFSQQEVIEFAREPVGRMVLIDAALDLSGLDTDEASLIAKLDGNTTRVTDLRNEIKQTRQRLSDLPSVTSDLVGLTEFFDAQIVKEQEMWSRERARLGKLDNVPELAAPPVVDKPRSFKHSVLNHSNQDLNQRAEAAYDSLHAAIDGANGQVSKAYQAAKAELSAVAREWKRRHEEFDARFSAKLDEIDIERKGFIVLKKRLAELQTAKAALEDAETHMREQLVPALETARGEREKLLDDLVALRRERRRLRQKRIAELNKLMSPVVRIKLAREANDDTYKQELVALAKGSRLRTEFLHSLAVGSLPLKLARSYLDADADGVSKEVDVDVKHVERLFEWITEKGLERGMLELQVIDLPDALSIDFRTSATAEYEPIEQLAHGQKCTAILIIALADGDQPLIIDQPEDALHAPWIEDHLVGRLRELRGGRQYIFATRSPGLVVSADAEMIITLKAKAEQGQIEATGSLERHDLNALVLYHLEGGQRPFKRRTMKLAPSMS